jgi:hypothetical protein
MYGMQPNLEIVARNSRPVEDVERDFIDLIADEVCNGIRGAVGAWMEKVEAIIASQDSDKQKLARVAALLDNYYRCKHADHSVAMGQ